MSDKCSHPLDDLTFHDCTDLQETRIINDQPYEESHCDNKDHCTVTVCGECGEQISHDKGTFDALEGPKDKTAKIRAVNPNLGKMFD
jgi:hypothetical protein